MRAAALLLVLLLAGCAGENAALPADSDPETTLPTTVSALDSLAERGGPVSVNGRVLDHAPGERELVLDDGTGLVRVRLPENPPGLTGHRLFVRGTLLQDDGSPVLEAVEWLYDSTAISIHSD